MVAVHPAVTHDQDPVRDGEHLGQAMGHEDHRHAPGTQVSQVVEQPLRLALGQGRRRLIE